MPFKFEKLEVWKLSLEYLELLYKISAQLPSDENYNLKSQIRRAGTSINLNIAEGSTSQTDAEQSRFLGMASDLFTKLFPASTSSIGWTTYQTKRNCERLIAWLNDFLSSCITCER